MSAEVLRRAAALMRERAEAATPGPWSCDSSSGVNDLHFGHVGLPVLRGPNTYGPGLADTEHMAGMDPSVALAVASWLDACALVTEVAPDRHKGNALAVARAYLGDDA